MVGRTPVLPPRTRYLLSVLISVAIIFLALVALGVLTGLAEGVGLVLATVLLFVALAINLRGLAAAK